MFDRKTTKDFDKALILATYLICLFGIIVLYSATQAKGLPLSKSFILKQMSWIVMGTVLFILMINFSYQKFIDMAYFLYGVNIMFLILVLLIGGARLGAQRWFSIGNFAFQPSEFIKLNLILALASYIGSRKEAMPNLTSLFVPIVLLALPFILVIVQPDLGTALILLPIFFSMLLIGGANLKYLIAMAIAGMAALPFFWHFMHGYQKQRLLVFLDPNIDPLGAGYTIIQSKVAVGSGGLFGKGWLGGTQNQLNFLPERHTDFIFSVVGEEWGFMGSAVLVLLYFFIIKRALAIASLTTDIYGKLIASGVAVMLALQIVINIGMTIGLMPVVGIPLPLVSYGGSSLIATFVAIGLLINVALHRSRF